MAINLRAPALCAKALLPLLKKGPGHIVNLSSEAGYRPRTLVWEEPTAATTPTSAGPSGTQTRAARQKRQGDGKEVSPQQQLGFPVRKKQGGRGRTKTT